MEDPGGDQLRRAEQFLRGGDPGSALPLLAEYLQREAGCAHAWWLLSFAAPDLKRQVESVERVLELDPGNGPARARLEKLRGRASPRTKAPPAAGRPAPKLKGAQLAVLGIMGCAVLGLLGFAAAMIVRGYIDHGAPAQVLPATMTQIGLPATWTPTPTLTVVPSDTPTLPVTLPARPTEYVLPRSAIPQDQISPSVGFYAPDFRLTEVRSDRAVSLGDYHGNPVVIYFWATWCEICKSEMPSMQTLYKSYQGNGLVFLAVDVGESASQARSYGDALKLTFPILDDSSQRVFSTYEVPGVPTFFFVEPTGRIMSLRVGGMDYWTLNAKVRELLKLDP
jgi:peroxiredoxin